jgi:hypothetical protein
MVTVSFLMKKNETASNQVCHWKSERRIWGQMKGLCCHFKGVALGLVQEDKRSLGRSGNKEDL